MKKNIVNRTTFILIIILLCLSFSGDIYGQFYFGKNKVQYNNFDWQMMETEHFNVYFYSDEQDIAYIGARIAEDSYRKLAIKFNFEVLEKTPLIIYSTPTYFSQTNVIPSLLPESVGGFTEFMKGRVVVPFNGSWFDFDHVICHELVHVFTLARLDEETSRHSHNRWVYPPLWFIEGIAEFWSEDWDAEGDMIVRDLVLNGKLLPIEEFYRVRGTYFMYKLGQSVCQFIDSAYGSDKLTVLFDNWYKGRTFNDLIEVTLGDDLKEVSRKWEYSLKKKYYPQLETRGLPSMESMPLTKDGYSLSGVPMRWDDGDGEEDWIVYKANKLGYTGIYMKKADKSGDNIKTLLKGERSANYESLYLLKSGIDVHPSGLIVFSARSKHRDRLNIFDLRKDRVTRRIDFDSITTIISPRFSPDGKQVVFSGNGPDGFTDLYLCDVETGRLNRITSDVYYEATPAFTSDGLRVVYASDRGTFGPDGALNLFSIDIQTEHVRQLTFGEYRDSSPDPAENGIYFSSNRDGAYNLYHLDNNGLITMQSTLVTGAFSPRVSSSGQQLVYTGYQDMQYQIYQLDLPEKTAVIANHDNYIPKKWTPALISHDYRKSSIEYESDYSFDIAQSAIGYDPVYGTLGGLQVMVSDMLGDKAYYILLTNTATEQDEFLESFNFGLTFINKKRRLNWGMGAFHLYNEYYNDYEDYYYERQAGGIALFSYPISKFHRLDFSTVARYSKKDYTFGRTIREVFLVDNYLSLVYDNAIWEITGPIEGRRYYFTVGLTTAVSKKKNFSRTAMADMRHYVRLGKYSAIASRLFGFSSTGEEPRRIYFGGSWSLRGYDRRAFYNRNVVLSSNELRFPLINNLIIGSPIGNFGFSAIRGALFFDAGSAWDDEFKDWYGGMGGGFRVALGYVVVLRFDITRTTDFRTMDPHTKFDFFFGWNF